MLVLSRNVNEEIVIGDDITIMVVRVHGGKVRIGISAPDGVRIVRKELLSEGESHDHRNRSED